MQIEDILVRWTHPLTEIFLPYRLLPTVNIRKTKLLLQNEQNYDFLQIREVYDRFPFKRIFDRFPYGIKIIPPAVTKLLKYLRTIYLRYDDDIVSVQEWASYKTSGWKSFVYVFVQKKILKRNSKCWTNYQWIEIAGPFWQRCSCKLDMFSN